MTPTGRATPPGRSAPAGLHALMDRYLDGDARAFAALAQLPAGQREIVELHKFQGLSMSEIATRLKIREGAVRVRAHRAYKALARWHAPTVRGLLLLHMRGGGA